MLQAYLNALPLWVLVAAAVIALVWVVGSALALRTRHFGWAGSLTFGAVLAGTLLITLTPSGDTATEPWCSLDSWAPLSPLRLFSLSHEALNVWVFALLGAAAMALPRRTRWLGIIVLALVPVLIEAMQYAVPALGRTCQSADLTNNWMGAVLGVALVLVTHMLITSVGRRGPSGDSQTG